VRAVGYVQAPPGQMDHPEFGIEAQRERIALHVSERGWQLVELLEEQPGSGGRPALTRLETRLAELDKLVILDLDRLPPSVDGALRFVRHLRREGVDLVSLQEGLDTGQDSGGALIIGMLERFARWQRRAAAREGWQAESLRKPGLAPATLVDVGVGPGTAGLYHAFPDSYLVLVEPLREFEPHMQRLVSERRGEYVLTAVGAASGEMELHVNPGALMTSSLLSHERPPEVSLEPRSVPITTLDALYAERSWKPPFGLKIDTEGFENEVIAGAGRLLEDTQFVLAEVSVARRFVGGYTFADFVAEMDARGFRLCDVLHVQRYRRDREAEFVDALFRR
jgi:FkbM family methyltransferase